ncbi:UNVERIFIED_CONTAM: hypothetical protein HDU68_003244 [Siphonaria sp. JEL0065]|nr:hypothetical protein HDU68_003244 [Siphonaria sp. JEL0065]
MSVSIEISGLLLAQLKYDMINASGGSCMGFLRGHTTDDAEDTITSRNAIVITGYVPFKRSDYNSRGSFIHDIASYLPNTIGMYSFRKSTRIDSTVSVKEEALFESLRSSLAGNLKANSGGFEPAMATLMLFSATTEGVVLNWDFAAYHRSFAQNAPFSRTHIQISNLIESTQSSHPVFISSLPHPASFPQNPLAKIIGRMNPQKHVFEHEQVLDDSMRVLRQSLDRLSVSERELADLRRRVAEKENEALVGGK